VEESRASSRLKKKKWTFLKKFRWTVYLVFIAFMVFVAVCLAVGIVSNLKWRHADLDVPVDRPEALSDLGTLQLRDCLSALETMRGELQEHVQQAMTGTMTRDDVLSEWKTWSEQWRKRFEKLGISCRLTEIRYDKNKTLGLLAEIYRLLDYFHRLHTRLVRRFATENAQPLYQMQDLFQRARRQIEVIEGEPVESSP
jgi:hypothetical protein